MADHVRKQIRSAVVTALTGLATTGSRVYPSRVYPLAKAKLPGLLVYTPDEGSARENTSMGEVPELMRDLIVQVHGIVRISANLEDEMDDLAQEVEVALDTLDDISGLVKNYHGLQGTISTLSAEEADHPYGAIALEFLYTYRTASGQPDIST